MFPAKKHNCLGSLVAKRHETIRGKQRCKSFPTHLRLRKVRVQGPWVCL